MTSKIPINFETLKKDSHNIPQHLIDIVGEYGAIVAKTSYMTLAAPESLLPYNKEIIRKSILEMLKHAKNETLIESLIIVYAELPKFISDDDAEFVNEISKKRILGIQYSQEDRKRFITINSKISDESEKYLQDFKNLNHGIDI